MLAKLSVKKPYFVFVAVVIILILGGVSLSTMKTDLLPEFQVPYLGVMISALCWLIYLCGLIACLWQRVRLMLGAWQGYRVSLPLVGSLAARFGNMEDAL